MGEPSSSRKSNNVAERPFGSGAREGVNDWDKFLESRGFYRKLTASDYTSLFRVVSELCYDIQLHHEKVRRECVDFMRENKPLFEEDIEMDFDAYLNNMSKNKTPGTTLELKALALHHKANVFLFQPLMEGEWFVNDPLHKDTWRIFVSFNNCFDPVFTLEYMKIAAECQSIVYEILFKEVLRIPDIEYAVERMLHDPDDTKTIYEKDDDGRTVATTEDGRKLVLSAEENTSCVRVDQLCHFHNKEGFSNTMKFIEENGLNEWRRVHLGETNIRLDEPTLLLHDSTKSCVRQLLDMRKAPLSYKVAKVLDRTVYRNIEYSEWQEQNKEQYNAARIQIGCHCYVKIGKTTYPCRILKYLSNKTTVLVDVFSDSEIVKYVVAINSIIIINPNTRVHRARTTQQEDAFRQLEQHAILHYTEDTDSSNEIFFYDGKNPPDEFNVEELYELPSVQPPENDNLIDPQPCVTPNVHMTYAQPSEHKSLIGPYQTWVTPHPVTTCYPQQPMYVTPISPNLSSAYTALVPIVVPRYPILFPSLVLPQYAMLVPYNIYYNPQMPRMLIPMATASIPTMMPATARLEYNNQSDCG